MVNKISIATALFVASFGLQGYADSEEIATESEAVAVEEFENTDVNSTEIEYTEEATEYSEEATEEGYSTEGTEEATEYSEEATEEVEYTDPAPEFEESTDTDAVPENTQ